jgi:hypothetical protein
MMMQICFSLRGRSCRLLGIHDLYYRDGRRYIHFTVGPLSRATHYINLMKAAGYTWDQSRKNTVKAIQEGAACRAGVVLHTLHFKCSGPLWRPGGTSTRSPSTAASAAACAPKSSRGATHVASKDALEAKGTLQRAAPAATAAPQAAATIARVKCGVRRLVILSDIWR